MLSAGQAGPSLSAATVLPRRRRRVRRHLSNAASPSPPPLRLSAAALSRMSGSVAGVTAEADASPWRTRRDSIAAVVAGAAAAAGMAATVGGGGRGRRRSVPAAASGPAPVHQWTASRTAPVTSARRRQRASRPADETNYLQRAAERALGGSGAADATHAHATTPLALPPRHAACRSDQ